MVVYVKLKRFLLVLGIVACWKAETHVTANNDTGGPLDLEQSDITDTELQNHENRHAVPEAHLGNGDQHSDHKTASADNGLTSVSQNDRNQISTRQTPIEINTGKTTQQQSSCQSHSPVHAETRTAADNSSHADKEHALTMTSVPMYGQRSQTVEDKSPDEMWRDLLKKLNSTHQNIPLKRIRRVIPRPDGNSVDLRSAVSNTYCACKYCGNVFQRAGYENAAFNKQAEMSSRFSTSSGPVSPFACSAVNGVLGFEPQDASSSRPNCIKTADGDNSAWWSINLQYEYTIAIFQLYTSIERGARQLMGGIDVLVDGKVCFDFYKGETIEAIRQKLNRLGLVLQLECKKPLTGRIMRFQKRPEDVRHFGANVVFCELLLWVCKIGTYGKYPQTCKRCPTECKYTCDNYWGCDVRVLHNAAVGRPVSASSSTSFTGRLLTDTVEGTEQSQCFQTIPSRALPEHFIRVSLRHSYLVFYVIVSGAVQCCSEQHLKNFYVSVMTHSNVIYRPPRNERCGFYFRGVPTRGKANITCTTPLWGKYVAVQQLSRESLIVCELEVFAHHRFRLALRSECPISSETIVCNEDAQCDDGQCRSLPGVVCAQSTTCPRNGFCDMGFCRLNVNAKCQSNTANQCARPMVCDVGVSKCRMVFNSLCKPGEFVCQSIATCDEYQARCKWKVGQACNSTSDCVTGASCVSNQCACTTRFSYRQGDICKPKPRRVGTPCAGNGDCDSAFCLDNICGCGTRNTLSPELFGCAEKMSAACTSDSDCSEERTCQTRGSQKSCQLKLGGFCLGFENDCVSGAPCEENYCRVGHGESCEGVERSCILGDTCFNGTCSAQVGSKCYVGSDCANSICSEPDNRTCRLRPGAKCDYSFQLSQTGCQAGTVCEQDQVCKFDLAQECSDTSLCLSGSLCAERQGSSEKKCRKPLGSQNCRTDEDCGINTICDHQAQCRHAKNSNCEHSPGLCLTGSLCVEGTCQCNPNVTDPETEKCDPKKKVVGGSCALDGLCADPLAICKDGTCKCEGTFAIDEKTLACGVRPGFQCKLDKSFSSCITGASCAEGFCALDPGEPCFGQREGSCHIQSICDKDRVCRLNLNQNCSGLQAQCRSGTVCDTLKRCKRKPGGYCRDAMDCMAGANCKNNTCICSDGIATLKDDVCSVNEGQVGGNCNQGGGCLDPLAKCNTNTKGCECSPGYTPDPGSLKCMKAVGEQCQGDSDCLMGSACDLVQKTCLLTLGQLCDGENGIYCSTGTVCDSTLVCKLDLKGNCSGENRAFCKIGTFCDWLGQCKNGLNDECNDTQEESTCIAGAVCSESICICDAQVATDYGAVCEPKAGRYGGQCAIKGSDCDVDHSVCDGSACVCSLGYKPNRLFGCESASKQRVVKGVTLIAVSVPMSVLLLMLIIGIYVYRRHRKRREKAKAAVSQRRGSMLAIQQLDQAVRENVRTASHGYHSKSSITHTGTTTSVTGATSTVTGGATSTVTGEATSTEVEEDPSADLREGRAWHF